MQIISWNRFKAGEVLVNVLTQNSNSYGTKQPEHKAPISV